VEKRKKEYFVISLGAPENRGAQLGNRQYSLVRRISGTYIEEAAGGCRRVHNEKVLELYCSSNVIWMIRTMRIRWVGHVACTIYNKNVSGFRWEKLRERGNSEDIGVDGIQNPNRSSRNRMERPGRN
jgi:hypothetical protein